MKKVNMLVIAFALFFVSCSKNVLMNIDEDYQSSSHKILYHANMLSDSIMNLSFDISRTNSNESVFSESLAIDFKKKNFQSSVVAAISSKSNVKIPTIELYEMKTICKTIKSMIDREHHDTKQLEKTGKYIMLSYMREQLAKNIICSESGVKVRKMLLSRPMKIEVQKEELEQNQYSSPIYEGYERDLSSFALNSDIIVNVSALKTQIQYDLSKGGDVSIDAQVFKSALESTDMDMITLSELLSNIETYVNKEIPNPSPSWWPDGHTHGCCGNYNGPCYYWHPICYVHDKICKKCSPGWFCLSGCVPDIQEVEPSMPTHIDPNEPIFIFLEDAI